VGLSQILTRNASPQPSDDGCFQGYPGASGGHRPSAPAQAAARGGSAPPSAPDGWRLAKNGGPRIHRTCANASVGFGASSRVRGCRREAYPGAARILKTTEALRVGTGTVHRVKRLMAAVVASWKSPPPNRGIDLTHRFLPFSPVEAPIGFVRADRFQPSLSPAFEDTFDLDFVVPDQQVMPVSTSIKGRGLASKTCV
jgi:hypothetical protein